MGRVTTKRGEREPRTSTRMQCDGHRGRATTKTDAMQRHAYLRKQRKQKTTYTDAECFHGGAAAPNLLASGLEHTEIECKHLLWRCTSGKRTSSRRNNDCKLLLGRCTRSVPFSLQAQLLPANKLLQIVSAHDQEQHVLQSDTHEARSLTEASLCLWTWVV